MKPRQVGPKIATTAVSSIWSTKGDKTMSPISKIVLAAAIVLSAGSVAMSAPKHPVHPVHPRYHTAKPHVLPPVYRSFGFVRGSAQPREPGYMNFQDRGVQDDLGG
jgi:hypothetical protein